MIANTNELTDPALDWTVAKAEGHYVAVAEGTGLILIRRGFVADYFDPSTNWGWGGPIIERERIHLTAMAPHRSTGWIADNPGAMVIGPTPLIAAMRCFVASKLGEDVEVPEELK